MKRMSGKISLASGVYVDYIGNANVGPSLGSNLKSLG